MRNNILILLGIIIIGLVLRFYQLGVVPGSLNWDEVSIGYNAYSILKTGQDEYGNYLPLTFRSFGDYKQPGYIYLSVPSIAVFGLNAFGVRFISALLGTFSIVSVYFLVKELFFFFKTKERLALLTAFLFAISPWSIQFSRFASEANVALFFMLTGAAFLLYSTRVKSNFLLFLSGLFLLVSMYTYHSHKIFTPFLLILLLLYRYQFVLKRKALIIIFLGVFFIGNIPWLVDGATTERGRSVLLTSAQTELLEEPIALGVDDKQDNDYISSILHNRRLVYGETYTQNYLSHFDPNFLFISGDNARHHAPDMGVLYLVSLPFILLGFFWLWKHEKKQALLITLWLLSAPGVSALAINAPNAIRSMMFLPLWEIFCAVGIISIISFFSSKKITSVIIAVIIGVYLLNVIYYLHQYFEHTNKEYAIYWQAGYQEAIEKSKDHTDMPVVFAEDIEQAASFYLFYTKKDPLTYLASGGSRNNEAICFTIDNAYFGNCLPVMSEGYLVTSKPPPENFQIDPVDSALLPNGEQAVGIYKFAEKEHVIVEPK